MKKSVPTVSWQPGFLAVIAFLCGAALTAYIYQKISEQQMAISEFLLIGLLLALFAAEFGVMWGLQRFVHALIPYTKLTAGTRQRFLKYHALTYLVFLTQGVVLGGAVFGLPMLLFLFLTFVVAQFVVLWLVADRTQKQQWMASTEALPLLFFISGFSALIYQVVWQRVLFATFGTNIESVTVIVSVFMFGLGVGALAGGQVQKRYPNRLLEFFVAIEVAIGVFGICSIPLIHAIGRIAPHDSLLALIATTYLLLAVPTMLMGSTLPVLVGHLQKRYTSVGAMVGKLYAYNTFGSAFASFLTVTLLFTVMGQQSTLIVAALCNGVTAYLVWVLCRQPAKPLAALGEKVRSPASGISFPTALILSMLLGYIALSLEILWMRILGFMTATRPQVFGIMLAIFLGGIAYGSIKAKRWSEAGKNPQDFISRNLIRIIMLAFFSVPLVGIVAASLSQPPGVALGYVLVGFMSCFSGGIFPLLCQISAKGKQTGVTVSWLYFLNIMGATAGSLITGFVFFDILTLGQNVIVICVITALAWLLLRRKISWLRWSAGVAVAIVMLILQPAVYGDIIARLQGFHPSVDLKYVNENRHGIITVKEDKEGDIIYGNGAYDGRFNIDPANKANIITRAYMLAGIHPHPRRVLEIGLSGGAWAKVFSMYKPLKELVSVEIDPGYLDVIKHYPEIDSIKRNPKWRSYVDDGRRWLTNHPDERFDVIVMNTSFYWRSNATNVLSREFLELCKRHLNPGGVVYYNATADWDVVYTAAHIFKYVATYVNLVVASDTPLAMTYDMKRENLLRFASNDGKPVFDEADPVSAEILETLANEPFPDIRASILKRKDLWLITDDNMASEYKVDHGFLPPHFHW